MSLKGRSGGLSIFKLSRVDKLRYFPRKLEFVPLRNLGTGGYDLWNISFVVLYISCDNLLKHFFHLIEIN